jgi:hypothetical protein
MQPGRLPNLDAEEQRMIVSSRAHSPAADLVVAAEVSQVLEQRGARMHPPVSLAVSDSVALGIAGIFRSETPSGRVMGRFYRTGAIDSAELSRRPARSRASPHPRGTPRCTASSAGCTAACITCSRE